MKKNKHNKKRNTAFLYEVLTKEITKSIVQGDKSKVGHLKKLVKEHFRKGSMLYNDLMSFRVLQKENIAKNLAEKVVEEVSFVRKEIDTRALFNEQTKLINRINKELSPSVYENFVPNYKSLATIYQMFKEEDLVRRVVLKERIIENMSSPLLDKKIYPADRLVFDKFIENFNKEYNNDLLEEQKKLIGNYIFSFSDNGVDIKAYVNEELERLSLLISKMKEMKEITTDEIMKKNTEMITQMIESFSERQVDDQMILKIMEIQELANELKVEELGD